jgi:hypothetical protein
MRGTGGPRSQGARAEGRSVSSMISCGSEGAAGNSFGPERRYQHSSSAAASGSAVGKAVPRSARDARRRCNRRGNATDPEFAGNSSIATSAAAWSQCHTRGNSLRPCRNHQATNSRCAIGSSVAACSRTSPRNRKANHISLLMKGGGALPRETGEVPDSQSIGCAGRGQEALDHEGGKH